MPILKICYKIISLISTIQMVLQKKNEPQNEQFPRAKRKGNEVNKKGNKNISYYLALRPPNLI